MAFYEDIGPRPSPHHSLGRVDNEGHYGPGNCRWEDSAQQNTNKRSNRRLTHKGISMTLGQWARETGIPGNVIGWRLLKDWPVSVILERPVRKMAQYK